MRFLARRIIHGVFLLAGVSLFSFMLLELAPGDFFEEMRLNPQISAETVAGLRKQYGAGFSPLPKGSLASPFLTTARSGRYSKYARGTHCF